MLITNPITLFALFLSNIKLKRKFFRFQFAFRVLEIDLRPSHTELNNDGKLTKKPYLILILVTEFIQLHQSLYQFPY